MWWDVAALSCFVSSLYVRFRLGDQRGGALFMILGSVCQLWGSRLRRWAGRPTGPDEE